MQEETPAENELAALKKNCGLKIAKARDKLGLSQYSFADKIGISRNSLREIENGLFRFGRRNRRGFLFLCGFRCTLFRCRCRCFLWQFLCQL